MITLNYFETAISKESRVISINCKFIESMRMNGVDKEFLEIKMSSGTFYLCEFSNQLFDKLISFQY